MRETDLRRDPSGFALRLVLVGFLAAHGPEFTCDLIDCTIQCGHDDNWPPHV